MSFKKAKPLLIHHADGIELVDLEKADRFYKKGGLLKKLYNLLMYKWPAYLAVSRVNHIVTGCQDDLNYLVQKFPNKKMICIAPGIDDIYRSIPISGERLQQVLFSGSWIERKGIAVIPVVIKQILASFPDCRFVVIGAANSKEQIFNAFETQFHSRITVAPRLSLQEFTDCYLKSMVFFFPSYSEGFGLAVAEAMACGCAVVTTPTGIGSLLTNAVNARICDYNDTSDMVGAISSLLLNQEKRDEMGRNAKDFAVKLDWETQRAKLIAVYSRWLEEKKAL